MRFKMNDNTNHPNRLTAVPNSLSGSPDARKFTPASVTDLPPRQRGPMDYPNPKNVMVDQQGRPIPPDGQQPLSVPAYKPPMPAKKMQASVISLVSPIVLIALLSGSIFAIWHFMIKPNTVA